MPDVLIEVRGDWLRERKGAFIELCAETFSICTACWRP